jgi:hypothetical protein
VGTARRVGWRARRRQAARWRGRGAARRPGAPTPSTWWRRAGMPLATCSCSSRRGEPSHRTRGARAQHADGREIRSGRSFAPRVDGRPLPFMLLPRGRPSPRAAWRSGRNSRRSSATIRPRSYATPPRSGGHDARRTPARERAPAALAAVVLGSGPYQSLGIIPTGLALPASRTASCARRVTCDRLSRLDRDQAVDLDEDGNVLVDYCGYPAYLGQDGRRVWLDRPLGRVRAARLARRGGWCRAAVDADGGLLPGAPPRGRYARAGRRRVALDSLGTVNWRGEIAGAWRGAVTGRTAPYSSPPALSAARSAADDGPSPSPPPLRRPSRPAAPSPL